jgi:hypothetical protein
VVVGGEPGIVTHLSGNTGCGASDLKILAVILGLTPAGFRPALTAYFTGLSSEGFVAFHRALSDSLLKSSVTPGRAVFLEVGDKMKTRAHTNHSLRSFSGKLKGDTGFQILLADDRWINQKNKDPPWDTCIKLEMMMILREFKLGAYHCFHAEKIRKLQEFLSDSFYQMLSRLAGITTLELEPVVAPMYVPHESTSVSVAVIKVRRLCAKSRVSRNGRTTHSGMGI